MRGIAKALFRSAEFRRPTSLVPLEPITEARFREVLSEPNPEINPEFYYKAFGLYEGLTIIRKYIQGQDLEYFKNDYVFACDIDDLIAQKITEHDIRLLNYYNWTFVGEDRAIAHIL